MKKLSLLILTMSLGLFSFAQTVKKDVKAHPEKMPVPFVIESNSTSNQLVPNVAEPVNYAVEGGKETNFVTQIPIGTSGNAFGFFVDGRTSSVWLDNRINSVAFTHRLNTPSSGHIGYDVSFDKGLTWQVDQLNYDPTVTGFFPARYPMGGIINPAGNTDPQNAVHTYIAPTLDNSNGTWGGIGYGAKGFAPGATPWQAAFTTTASDKWFLPDAFTITQQGVLWFVDEETDYSTGTAVYLGSIIVAKGMYDAETGEIEYTYNSIPIDVEVDGGINDIEIAFAPDGQTGYISLLTSLIDPLPYTSYHPVFLKTTDGGETWSDPIEVQLGGADGLDAVKNFITDETLLEYFEEPLPSRDEIIYYIGYNQDLVVDAWGNPHISGNVMLGSEDGIYPYEGVMGMFHIWSPDGGESWDAFNMAYLKQFSAEFAGGGSTVSQYNRPQIGTTMDGTLLFFSWLDSDLPEAEDNTRPDIYFRDFVPYEGDNGVHGEMENVTFLSPAMWTANWATMPYYVFSQNVGDNSVQVTIPWVYQKLDVSGDISLPVQFFYIPDFTKTYTITALNEINASGIASVSQNRPNPFNGSTVVDITLARAANVQIDVYNLTGQKVESINLGQLPAGATPVQINADKLKTGVYFYTVQAGTEKITRKMIVR